MRCRQTDWKHRVWTQAPADWPRTVRDQLFVGLRQDQDGLFRIMILDEYEQGYHLGNLSLDGAVELFDHITGDLQVAELTKLGFESL